MITTQNAVTGPTGTTQWYKDMYLHREDGPAVIWSDGTEEWYLHDICYSTKLEFEWARVGLEALAK